MLTTLRRIALFQRFPTIRSRVTSWPPMDPASYPKYPDFADDFAALEAELLPTFTKFDREALLNQNRYRRQRSTVLFGAAILAAFGGLQAVLPDQRWPTIVVLLLGILLAASSQMANETDRLSEYLQDRTRAERLRALFFVYLSRTGIYGADSDDQRRADLARAVVAIEGGKELE